MRLYRTHLTRLSVVVCVFALLSVFVSYGLTFDPLRYSNANLETLDSDSMQWSRVLLGDRTGRIEVRVEYVTDHEFDIWLMDSADWNRTARVDGPETWLGHGIAGTGVDEWTVSLDDLEGDLILVEESKVYGERGAFGNNVLATSYDYEISVRSVINPMESFATWMMLSLVGLAGMLLVSAMFLPREELVDFMDLYPGFPTSMRTGKDDHV
jgi:hypothetical protein